MVSLQSESTPWFHYNQPLPSKDEYVSTYSQTACPSYECDTQLITQPTGDSSVEQDIQRYLHNQFVYEYINSSLRGCTNYTLFLPIQCDRMIHAVQKCMTPGESWDDRERRAEGYSERDQLIRMHICPYQIYPVQLQEQDTRITTHGGKFMINSFGWITSTNMVRYVKTYPHATVFFITSEIE
jgi:hypothetical protein